MKFLIKEICRRHYAAVKADKDEWEKRVRDILTTKAKAGLLSPLPIIICQHLLHGCDLEVGRRHLLEQLYLQVDGQCLKIQNFLLPDNTPDGAMMVNGGKVKHLRRPISPFGSPPLEQLSPTILTESEGGICKGGSSASQSLSKFYLEEKEVIEGGAAPFPLWIKKEIKRDISWTCNPYSMHSPKWKSLQKPL